MRFRMLLNRSFLPDWRTLWLLASPKYNQMDLPDRISAVALRAQCPIPWFRYRSQLSAPELPQPGES
jgi:hypothetical protein